MTLFRYRRWGTPDWTEISISSDEDEDGVTEVIEGQIRDLLRAADMHAQECDGEGNWEDIG